MKGALIILGVMVLIGVVLYIGEVRHRRRVVDNVDEAEEAAGVKVAETPDGDSEDDAGSECCGLHLVCEKDSLSPMSGEIEYFDDEELDRFIGRAGTDYTPEEIEEFRDVLMTLRPDDVAGWARSVTARRLELPSEIRDELLMLVNEQRAR